MLSWWHTLTALNLDDKVATVRLEVSKDAGHRVPEWPILVNQQEHILLCSFSLLYAHHLLMTAAVLLITIRPSKVKLFYFYAFSLFFLAVSIGKCFLRKKDEKCVRACES